MTLCRSHLGALRLFPLTMVPLKLLSPSLPMSLLALACNAAPGYATTIPLTSGLLPRAPQAPPSPPVPIIPSIPDPIIPSIPPVSIPTLSLPPSPSTAGSEHDDEDANPTPYEPGFGELLDMIIAQAEGLPSHSWEYGTAVEALLELYNPPASVFGSGTFKHLYFVNGFNLKGSRLFL